MKYNTKLKYKLPCRFCHKLCSARIGYVLYYAGRSCSMIWKESYYLEQDCKQCDAHFLYINNDNAFSLKDIRIYLNDYSAIIDFKENFTKIFRDNEDIFERLIVLDKVMDITPNNFQNFIDNKLKMYLLFS